MAAPPRSALVDAAPAKVNLTLRVTGRRRDGYHLLDSQVAFAAIGDRLGFEPGGKPALTVRGRFASAIGPAAENLVMRAAQALAKAIPGLTTGHFTLTKNLPVAAGLGGGSADAAAALRLLARANGIERNDARLIAVARGLGADVPVCLEPRARRMRGVGDELSAPATLPRLAAVLVNPGVALATKDVFAALHGSRRALRRNHQPSLPPGGAPLRRIAAGRNDLEPVAIGLAPVVARVLAALRATPGCRIARMSGSGATCFGLFASPTAADRVARNLAARHRGWWVRATVLR